MFINRKNVILCCSKCWKTVVDSKFIRYYYICVLMLSIFYCILGCLQVNEVHCAFKCVCVQVLFNQNVCYLWQSS